MKILAMGMLLFSLFMDTGTNRLNEELSSKLPVKLKQDYILSIKTEEGCKPIQACSQLIAKKGTQEVKIDTIEDFSQVIEEIKDEKEALALVNFLTSESYGFLFKDSFCRTLQKRTSPEQKFLVVDEQTYQTWKLEEPKVEQKNGQFHITRFLICYPQYDKGEKEAQLIKVHERLDKTGKYEIMSKEVVVKGAEVQKLLPYYK
jgi:hypothetical protein